MSGRPSYPWGEGDALFASELNAAIANAGALSNANTFNVRDHGVKMDGVTDDYAALNAVVTLAGGTGAVIYFPPSSTSLILSAVVQIPSNQTWWAYPGSVTIAPTAGNTTSAMLWSTAYTNNVRLHGLTFDGGGQDFANANPVSGAYQVNGLVLDQVTFRNTRGMAFNGVRINDLNVRGCTFTNIGNHWKATASQSDAATALSNSNGDGVTWGFRTVVENSVFSEVGFEYINLGAVQGVQIINNRFSLAVKPWLTLTTATAFNAAIFPLFCSNVVIAGNSIEGMSGNAIDAPGVVDMTISGNIIRNSGQSGLGIFDAAGYPSFGTDRSIQNVTITGNVIENSGQWAPSSFRAGINIGGTTLPAVSIRIGNNVITDTQTTKTQQYGVRYVGPTPSGVWVDPSNMLAGNVVAPTNGLSPAAVTGSRGGNAALASLLTTLAGFGLITDSTTGTD